jgi:hypothetical protein
MRKDESPEGVLYVDGHVNLFLCLPDGVRKSFFAYRAETALCNIAKIEMLSPEKAGTLIRKFYSSDADIYGRQNQQPLNCKITSNQSLE